MYVSAYADGFELYEEIASVSVGKVYREEQFAIWSSYLMINITAQALKD